MRGSQRVDEGISEDEGWRLFHQIIDALVHMTNLGILHRDIKLTNIFIDAQGDCKVGDFGLATSSLAAVDPSDCAPNVATFDGDMTLGECPCHDLSGQVYVTESIVEVGTRLYIAPEIQQTGRRGPRNHNKADMYSLGIVFFEMNYRFSTGSERIAVLENLRKPGIFFPPSWEPHRTRQKESACP
jgi:translation initiation factor 2-alpha kinase 4